MDKLAKRVAVAATVFAAASAVVLGVGLFRVQSKLEQDAAPSKPADAPVLTNGLSLPEEPVAAPAPVPSPAAAEQPQQDLAAAFGNALGVEVKKTPPPAPGAAAPAPVANSGTSSKASTSADSLDLGFGASSRDAKLNTREAKPLDVRQTGGEKAQLKQEKSSDRISFETDLGKAR